jgi:hypothetical protein
MIEWVEAGKFFDQEKTDEKELVLLYNNKNEDVVAARRESCSGIFLVTNRFTHAAKINIPVEKTLEEKLIQHYREAKNIIEQIPNMDRAIISDFAVIAKSHYEVDK